MDMDEPVLEFLKSYAWSCGELLEKVQIPESTQSVSESPVPYHLKEDPPSVPEENLEDIRNNLKLQLIRLRRKKQHMFLPITTKLVENIEYRPKLSNIVLCEGKAVRSMDENLSVAPKYQDTLKNDTLEDSNWYALRNELGVPISDVRGGISSVVSTEIQRHEAHSKISGANRVMQNSVIDAEEDAFQEDSLEQIRTIIFKRRLSKKPKELFPNHDRESIQSAISPFPDTRSTEKTSGVIFSKENYRVCLAADNIGGLRKMSPFVSEILDEFLAGDTKLNVSYEVPRSGLEAGLRDKMTDDTSLMMKNIFKLLDRAKKAKSVTQKKQILERKHCMTFKKYQRVGNSDSQKCVLVENNKVGNVEMETLSPSFHENKSYILCNDVKLWVKTICRSKCIVEIVQKDVVSADPKPKLLSPSTQRVMKTGEKTVLVGLACRYELRSDIKKPTRYSDFIESIKAPKPKPTVDTIFTRKCSVSLKRLDLSEIIPYCLAHSLYDCHCEGKSDNVTMMIPYFYRGRKLRNNTPKKHALEQLEGTISIDKVTSLTGKSQTPLEGIAWNVERESYYEDYIAAKELDLVPTGCSRVREIAAEYSRRIIYDEAVFKHDFIHSLTDYDMLRAKMNFSREEHQLLEADLLKHHLVATYMADNIW